MKKAIVLGICLLVVLAVGAVSAEGIKKYNDSKHSKIQTLFKPIDAEARKYINENDILFSQDIDSFAGYIVKRYGENLDLIVDELENVVGKSLTKIDKEELKFLIVREHLSKILHEHNGIQNAYKQEVRLIPIDTYKDSTYTYMVFYAPLSSDIPYPIYYWIQVSPDVNGGSGTDDAGNSYNVNGNNSLYKVSVEYSSNYVKYTLHFYDEDHPDPTLDATYDAWRLIWYGRTEDVESFTVQDGVINFNDIWDNNKTYAEWWGQHGDITRNYTSSTKVYVSNVWNHAMDTLDKNLGMDKVWLYTGWG
ncbi:hypothetical protein [Geoglobus acetivorans]|uniref:Uncharacterized protein n=1 Tax=Geoglobus acetivorans TaxID=565033 RepID=A0ABZ3H3B9_GEOAI|nr:hypothetical protein [Geoglobus acetivorans]